MARKTSKPAAPAPRFVPRNDDNAWWFAIPRDTRALYIKMWTAYFKRPIHLMDEDFKAFVAKHETSTLHAELLA